jgi:uncharacterized C2H2 Zn-finger protein
MSAHKCPVCHLLFRFRTELESHVRDEHLQVLTRPEDEPDGLDEDEHAWRLVRRAR